MTDNRTKVNIKNFKTMFPRAPMTFEKLLVYTYIEPKRMRINNTFNTVRFLYINDIITIVEKAIEMNSSPNKEHKEKWSFFLLNDLQEALDNEHEMLNNID